MIKIEKVKDEYGVAKPVLLVEKGASIFKGLPAVFALRLCNGFPLSKEQRDEFRKFVEWATEEYTSPCIKAVLRFFLSWPDMDFRKGGIQWKGGDVVHLELLSTWIDLWNFTFGQLMNGYKKESDWDNSSFREVGNKGTEESIGKQDYEDVTEQWVKKNDALRNVADRKKLEERFKMFLESLKGFTDWNTEGGTIEDWENYQLKRWKAYKDLTKEDKDLPESLTTRKAIRDAEKK